MTKDDWGKLLIGGGMTAIFAAVGTFMFLRAEIAQLGARVEILERGQTQFDAAILNKVLEKISRQEQGPEIMPPLPIPNEGREDAQNEAPPN